MPTETCASVLDRIDALAGRHRELSSLVRDADQRARFDRLALLTIHRARGTLRAAEMPPVDERQAVGAMYAACEVGLRLLELIDRIAWPARHDLVEITVRDLWQLVDVLFRYVIDSGGDPELELVT